jgi:hypothetical protein
VPDDLSAVEVQAAERVVRGPPALRRGTGIEQPLPVDTQLVDRLVTVPVDDDRGVGEAAVNTRRAPLRRAGLVDHGDGDAFEVELQRLGQHTDEVAVVVAEHCMHGCERGELVQQMPGDHVACVQHDVDVSELGVDRVREPTRTTGPDVRVREDERAYQRASSLPIRNSSGVAEPSENS